MYKKIATGNVLDVLFYVLPFIIFIFLLNKLFSFFINSADKTVTAALNGEFHFNECTCLDMWETVANNPRRMDTIDTFYGAKVNVNGNEMQVRIKPRDYKRCRIGTKIIVLSFDNFKRKDNLMTFIADDILDK